MRKATLYLALLLCSMIFARAAHAQQHRLARDTGAVFFDFNKDVLSEASKTKIDELIYRGAIDDRSAVSIIGYADYVGGEDYNLDLSRRRADAVKDYLIRSGFRPASITVIIGKGKIERADKRGNTGFAPDRKVNIVRTEAPVVMPQPLRRKDSVQARRNLSTLSEIGTLEPGQVLIFDKIFFYAGRHVIRPESAPALDLLYRMLDEAPTVRIRIEGHVCCIRRGVPDALDEDTGGLVLSTNRARAIRQHLIEKGIDGGRLECKGFGKSMPVVANEVTEEEADKNRRVEIRILSK